MGLFKRRKKEEENIDTRTEIERKFEEGGRKAGEKTGKIVQRGVNKLHKVKQKLEEDGTIDKLRDISIKVDDKIDEVVDVVTKKSKQVVKKVKSSKKSGTIVTEEYYD